MVTPGNHTIACIAVSGTWENSNHHARRNEKELEVGPSDVNVVETIAEPPWLANGYDGLYPQGRRLSVVESLGRAHGRQVCGMRRAALF
jgi:hypothetical protein